MPRVPLARSWQGTFARWLRPFLAALGREAQRHWAPVYLQGLLGPAERKSVAPLAARVAPDDVQQLHHFVATSPWATAPLEQVLARTAQRLVGGPQAVLIIDDTALPTAGRGRAEVLPDQSPSDDQPRRAGPGDQGPLGVRTGPSADEGRARARSL